MFNRKYIFKWWIFHCYVRLLECNSPLIRPYFLRGIWLWGGSPLGSHDKYNWNSHKHLKHHGLEDEFFEREGLLPGAMLVLESVINILLILEIFQKVHFMHYMCIYYMSISIYVCVYQYITEFWTIFCHPMFFAIKTRKLKTSQKHPAEHPLLWSFGRGEKLS